MDQVRVVLNVLWTQRFWVLSLLGTIVGTVCWNLATTDLDGQFKKRKSAINNAFSSVNNIKREMSHPNENVNAGDTKQARAQRDIVIKAWKELYQRQRTEVTKWPASIGEEFVGNMEGKKFGDRISAIDRGFYLDYIEKRFDTLLEIVDAKKMSDGRGSGYGGGMGGEYRGGIGETTAGSLDPEAMEAEKYLVQWLDQENLQKKLSFQSTPTDMQVWVTQEDLWVYETLLGVIAKTNQKRGATIPDNTAVRVIVELQVGAEAAGKLGGSIHIPKNSAGAGGSQYGGGIGEYGGGMGEYGGGMEGGNASADDTALVANRYLDPAGNPVEVTPGSYGSTEFRKLPVRMKLLMDQRWIPRVLIECANAALPVEVKQLRINPEKSGAGFGGRSAVQRPNSQAIKGLGPEANLSTVEIQGVVYIYNEPDTKVLSVPSDSA